MSNNLGYQRHRPPLSDRVALAQRIVEMQAEMSHPPAMRFTEKELAGVKIAVLVKIRDLLDHTAR